MVLRLDDTAKEYHNRAMATVEQALIHRKTDIAHSAAQLYLSAGNKDKSEELAREYLD